MCRSRKCGRGICLWGWGKKPVSNPKRDWEALTGALETQTWVCIQTLCLTYDLGIGHVTVSMTWVCIQTLCLTYDLGVGHVTVSMPQLLSCRTRRVLQGHRTWRIVRYLRSMLPLNEEWMNVYMRAWFTEVTHVKSELCGKFSADGIFLSWLSCPSPQPGYLGSEVSGVGSCHCPSFKFHPTVSPGERGGAGGLS